MSLVFAGFTPHPPIIIPEIGKDDTKKVKNTIKAMEKLAEIFENAEPDAAIVISPHGLVYPDRMNICAMPKLEGDLSYFGCPEIKFRFENNIDIAKKIAKASLKEGIEAILYNNGEQKYKLDHGTLVPFYFLTKNYPKIKILPISYSGLDKIQHFAFGQVISEVIKKTNKRIAIIASGDLSHRLIPHAPAGYSEAGKEFDEKLIKHIKNNDVQSILEFDDDFLEEAGECGLKSLIILLGAIESEKPKPNVLSYEGPFGVGYAVVNYRVENE